MSIKLLHRRTFLAQAMLISMACSAFGQGLDFSGFHFGPFASVSPFYSATELAVPGFSVECGLFTGGSGLGWNVGGLVEVPVASSFALQLRPSLGGAKGDLSVRIPTDLPVARNDGTVVPAVVEQRLAFTRLDIALGLLLRYPIASNVFLHGGLSVGRTISADQIHSEVVISPDDLLLVNNRRDFTLAQGELLRRSSLDVGVDVGVALDLPISSVSTVSPELTISLPITSRTPDGTWHDFAIHVGAALRFGIHPPAVDTIPLPPPVEAPPLFIASINTRPSVVSVQIVDYDSVEFLPLLNQIFFAEGDDQLSSRYRQFTPEEAEKFTKDDLVGSALDVYYHLLNIVGMRMREAINSTLTISGYRNSRERDPMLAVHRAEGVKRYLQTVWGIAPRRLRVKGGGLPPNPSRETVPEGLEENARVEIVSDNPNVTSPWIRTHTLRIATPPEIVFFPRAVAASGIDTWQLEILNREAIPWRRFSGHGALPDSIVWSWRSDSGALPSIPIRLSYSFALLDSAGQGRSSGLTAIDINYVSSRQRLEHHENDTTIENYSLLLFNFDSPEVSSSDRELLQAIGANVGHRALVRIIGYTDSLGEAGHNHQLATERARATARIFKDLVPSDVTIIVDESGGERERFPYSTPEGRSHCRTVFIEVRTPTEGDGS